MADRGLLGWLAALLALGIIAHPGSDATAQADDAELIEQLSAIGYVAGSEKADGRYRVLAHEPDAVAPGLNLLTSGHGPVALLIDMNGDVVHTWRVDIGTAFPDHPRTRNGRPPARNFWRVARLLPNGDLIVLWELFGLFKIDRTSKVLWALPSKAHHDLQVTEDGRIYHLEATRRPLPEIPGKPSIDDFIVERDGDGNELSRLAISEVLQEVGWPELRRRFWERNQARGYELRQGRFDPFHTNSLRILSREEATRLRDPFRPGDILVSMAMLDTVAAVDPRTGKIRWWQQGPFGMQHHARVTLDGDIVVFNNHYAAERSAVQAFDPRTHQNTWRYGGWDSEPLYSRRSGGVEVLPNGNLLIVETDRGRAIEVTRDKRVVWEYRSPYRVGERSDRVAGIYSLQRVPESKVPWLSR